MSKTDKKKSADTPKYKEGSATKGTNVDLNAINFKNKDVIKWSNKRGSKVVPKGISLSGLGKVTRVKRL